MKKLFLILLLSAGILASCSKNDTPDPDPQGGDIKMIVVNEGGMGAGFGALTAITYDGVSKEDVFRDVNGRPMGDVALSITCING